MDFHNRPPLRENIPTKKWQDVAERSEMCRSLIGGWVGGVHRNIFSDGKQKVLVSDATELFYTLTCFFLEGTGKNVVQKLDHGSAVFLFLFRTRTVLSINHLCILYVFHSCSYIFPYLR